MSWAWVVAIGVGLFITEFTSVVGDTLGAAIAGPGLLLLSVQQFM